MKCFLGIDGGGTKTAFLLADKEGRCIAQVRKPGCSYKEMGITSVAGLLEEGTKECLEKAGIPLERLSGAVIGLPCYGEIQNADGRILRLIREKFAEVPFYITNDAEVGWAGSLAMCPGINVVAGTGSIAYGKNAAGISMRSGGWSEFFGDEGSCYWLGRRTMELFSKEADGRRKKGALYGIVMEKFRLKNAVDFIDMMDHTFIRNRSQVASLQKLLLEAARQGDDGAVFLYQEAAEELGLMVGCIAERLWKGEKVSVSYSGGLFHAEEFVLPAFKHIVEKSNGILQHPVFSPVKGAVLLAQNMKLDETTGGMVCF